MPRLSTNSALWGTRLSWLAATVLVPIAITSAARGRTSWAENVATTTWWITSGAVVVALVVCGPIGLTVVRMLAPCAIPIAVLSLVLDASAPIGVAALAAATLVTLSAFMAETGEACVHVSAYGDERRLPLRVPAAMQIPIAIAWMLWVATLVAGVLLVAAERMALGIALIAVASVLTWLIYQRLHRFSCRWLVSVPAGVVIHDPVVLGETLMVLRPNVLQARLALADTEAADLSGPAAGHALEIRMREMVQVVFAATKAKPKGTAIHAQAVLVAPSRPGRALRALADRKIPVA
ncbi:MAG: hypothetical protein ABL953_04235 [Ilumatobacteraceae bacterium]